MTIMKTAEDGSIREEEVQKAPETAVEPASAAEEPAEKEKQPEEKKNDFADGNLMESVNVDAGEKPKEMDLGSMNRQITITPDDKVAFMDAVVNNSRFTKEYSLFGGKIKFTVRSLTSDETNAIATWIAKCGTRDSAGLLAGRYRKYLMAAQIAKYNGVDMPPLDTPLFETLDKDGKTVKEPGWTNRGAFWDGMGAGPFQAIMGCLADFDLIYSTLCRKAEDANFWNPDTP